MKRSSFILLVGIAAAGFTAGGLWLVMKTFFGIVETIVPGSGFVRSTSTQARDIVLRSGIITYPASIRPKTSTKLPKIWKIRLPRAYINLEYGSNGDISRLRSGTHIISFDTFMDLSAQSFRPTTLPPKQLPSEDRVWIEIRNEPTKSIDEMTGDFCENNNTRLKFSPPCDEMCSGSVIELAQCRAKTSCTVYMGYSGWSVNLSIPFIKYDQYNNYCRSVKAFVRQYTVSQDPVFIETTANKNNGQ